MDKAKPPPPRIGLIPSSSPSLPGLSAHVRLHSLSFLLLGGLNFSELPYPIYLPSPASPVLQTVMRPAALPPLPSLHFTMSAVCTLLTLLPSFTSPQGDDVLRGHGVCQVRQRDVL